ncbi:unnamed protein product [Pleuronectes platessa]|uniref:Uncharacterized protein n=1 Tax=Pleuronectes platessa TaxID=8262 RepID=A0A9N7YJZ2_PLEPL|nr:unnamed protein product [Pleuronectes platessa]
MMKKMKKRMKKKMMKTMQPVHLVLSTSGSSPPGFSGGGSGVLSVPAARILSPPRCGLLRVPLQPLAPPADYGGRGGGARGGGGGGEEEEEEEEINKSSIVWGAGGRGDDVTHYRDQLVTWTELNIVLQPKIETNDPTKHQQGAHCQHTEQINH